jgi:hypothetical protein
MWEEEGEEPADGETEEEEAEPGPVCIMYWSWEEGKEPSWPP